VSRHIEGEDREELKENLDQLEYPKGMSLIARTAGIGRTAPELQWDLNYMLKLWSAIDGASKAGKGAFLIYQESSLVIRAIRDYFTADVGEILIDTDDIYDQAQQFMAHVMPETAHKVKRYRDDAPLFSRFQIEHQIETAFSRTVNLPSGGAIVIDHTEALVSVDVNSARSTRGSDIEETATRTNLEAADEIARQMRLRDLGGLIVVDFIDMEESKNRREVETRLRDALRQDRARVQFSSISKFGLLELSRQRLRPALSEGSHITCPRCNGTGHIRDTESSALQILRMVQEESMKDNTAAVHVQVPVEVTSFLLNEKRTEITKIELKQRVTVLLLPNKNLDTPNYRLERLRHDDPRLENLQASYTMIDEADEDVTVTRREKTKAKQEPVIKGILPETPAPVAAPKPAPVAVAAPEPAPVTAPAPAPAAAPAGGGFFGWVKNLFGSSPLPTRAEQPVVVVAAAAAAKANEGRGERSDRGERGGRGGRGGRDGGRDGARDAARDGAGGRDGGKREGRGDGRGEGRGRRNERGERPAGEEGARTESADAVRSDERGGRGGNREERRPEGRGEPRGEGRGESRGEPRGDGRRGSRPEREARPATPVAEGTTDEAVVAQPFVDTLPGADAPEALDANGERQPGRRRNRRGGRGGRDRDEAVAATDSASTPETAGASDAGVNLQAQAGATDAGTSDQAAVAGDAGNDAGTAGPDGTPRGEAGEGRRRGRGRDRQRRDRTDEGQAEPATHGEAHDLTAAADGAAMAVSSDGQPTAAVYTEPAAPVAQVEPVHASRHASIDPVVGAERDMPATRHAAIDAVAGAQREAPPATRHAAIDPIVGAERAAPAARHAAIDPVVGAQREAPPTPATAHATAPAPAPVASTFELPLASLQSVAKSAGLQWVNSDADKIRAVQATMAAEPAAVRVPRERKPAVTVDDGPLVLVETRKDLSQFKLPFETAEGSQPQA